MNPDSSVVLEPKQTGLNARLLQDFVERARHAAKLRGSVNVLIVRDQKIRRLNSKFRGKDLPTDVLSFPAARVNRIAGDIAISIDIATRNARKLGHSVSDEVGILILHGILHLAGYDHEKDRGQMARKEIALRKKLGLPTGLIERNGTPAVVSRAPSAGTERKASRAKLAASDARRSRT